MREAFIQTLQEALGDLFGEQNKVIWVKAYNMIRNIIEDRDVDDDDISKESDFKLDVYRMRLVQHQWNMVKAADLDVVGPLVYKNMFDNTP